MSWLKKTEPHPHKWLDISRSNTRLPIQVKIWSYEDPDYDTNESSYEVIPDVPHICILQKCESCGDVRTVNLRGTLNTEAVLKPELLGEVK